jgi:hypothetical protein
LKRAARSSGFELASVTKALSYPSTQSGDGGGASVGPICLEVVKEQDGEVKDLSQGIVLVEVECPLKVSTVLITFCV